MAKKTTAPKAKAKDADESQGHPIFTSEGAHVVGAIVLHGNGVAVVSVSTFKADIALDIRRYYLDSDQGEPTWRPTSKGIRLNPAAAEQLIAMLDDHGDEIMKLLKS